jgi:hypothetical protein
MFNLILVPDEPPDRYPLDTFLLPTWAFDQLDKLIFAKPNHARRATHVGD